jgi:hypothetical protein
MGQRFRLKADYDTSSFPDEVRVILQALKKYGMILADNGSSWFISGVPDERWDNERLATIRNVPGSAFEAVDCSSLMFNPDSGQALQGGGIQPDIQINSSDGPVTIGAGETVTVTVSLTAGPVTSRADWWVAARTPSNTWYNYIYPEGWRPRPNPAAFSPAYQGSLFDLPAFALLSASSDILPAGDYMLYFGVDLSRNGNVDFDTLTYDAIRCTIAR